MRVPAPRRQWVDRRCLARECSDSAPTGSFHTSISSNGPRRFVRQRGNERRTRLGGSGAGIRSFSSLDELAAAELDSGLDGTLVVQEHLPARGDSIVRVEILGGEFLYAIRILLLPGSFNLCPADYCELPGVTDGVSGRGLPIEAYEPPSSVIDDAKRIVAAAGMDLGGVEYLVNARDGRPTFYDINALSNFVANPHGVVGFDPFVNLVDLIERRVLDAAPAAVA